MMTVLYSLQNNPEGTKNTLRLTYTAHILLHGNSEIQGYWYLVVESGAYGTKFFLFSEPCNVLLLFVRLDLSVVFRSYCR